MPADDPSCGVSGRLESTSATQCIVTKSGTRSMYYFLLYIARDTGTDVYRLRDGRVMYTNGACDLRMTSMPRDPRIGMALCIDRVRVSFNKKKSMNMCLSYNYWSIYIYIYISNLMAMYTLCYKYVRTSPPPPRYIVATDVKTNRSVQTNRV